MPIRKKTFVRWDEVLETEVDPRVLITQLLTIRTNEGEVVEICDLASITTFAKSTFVSCGVVNLLNHVSWPTDTGIESERSFSGHRELLSSGVGRRHEDAALPSCRCTGNQQA